MADRFPLIADSTTNQIKEIENGDNLNLSGNNIINAGIVTANFFYGDASNLTGIPGATTGGEFTGDIYGNIDIEIVGIITANSFYGNGSNLTNVNAETLSGFSSDQFLRSDVPDDGSNLTNVDAETLDGLNSDQFLRSDVPDDGSNLTNVDAKTLSGFSSDQFLRSNVSVGGSNLTNVNAETLDGLNSDQFLRSDVPDDGSNLTNVDAETLDSLNSGQFLRSDVPDDGSNLTNVNVETLSGINSDQFLRSDVSDQKTNGTLRFNDNVILSFGNSNNVEFFYNGNNFYIDLNTDVSNFYIREGAVNKFTFNNNGNFTASGIISATSFSGDGSNLTGVGIGSTGDIIISGIITTSAVYAQKFVGTGDKLIFSPTVTSFSPTDGATDVSVNTNIVLTFDQPIYAGSGSVFLRNSSSTGTVIEEIGISSSMINNQTLTINPSSNLPPETDVYVVLPQGVITNSVGGNNALLDTYNFTTSDSPELGDPYEGGYLICQEFGVQWIVAPESTEVSRDWYNRNDAVTTAESNAPCGDWFVPACGRLKNPGYECRQWWDSYSSSTYPPIITAYWSSTQDNSPTAYNVMFDNGGANNTNKPIIYCVRAFRCVNY